MRKQYSFVFDQMLRSNSLQSFKQIEQKTPEILHFNFFTVLQDCVCDVIFKVQMKCFFIAEFERVAKIRKIAVYRFLISLLVPEL